MPTLAKEVSAILFLDRNSFFASHLAFLFDRIAHCLLCKWAVQRPGTQRVGKVLQDWVDKWSSSSFDFLFAISSSSLSSFHKPSLMLFDDKTCSWEGWIFLSPKCGNRTHDHPFYKCVLCLPHCLFSSSPILLPWLKKKTLLFRSSCFTSFGPCSFFSHKKCMVHQ